MNYEEHRAHCTILIKKLNLNLEKVNFFGVHQKETGHPEYQIDYC